MYYVMLTANGKQIRFKGIVCDWSEGLKNIKLLDKNIDK
jgi:hypothetical protein